MIVSHRNRFAFIHIPKCAGTALRAPLEPLQEEPEFSQGGARDHPLLGRVDIAHVPLATLAEHWPDVFAALRTYRLFAVLRDPVERFGSAMGQHAQMYRDQPIERMEKGELRALLGDVIERLDGAGAGLLPPELIHFQPQSDYVEWEGQRIVDNLYNVSQAGQALRDMVQLVPDGILREARTLPEGNRGMIPRSRAAGLAWKAAKRVPVLRHAAGSVLLRQRQEALLPMLREERTASFLRDYYRADFALHGDVIEAR